MPRVFVGADVGERVRQLLDAAAAGLRDRAPRAKWVPQENLHLTLAFIGSLPEERLAEVCAALDLAAAVHPAPALRLGGGGSFGSAGRPRVLWAGVEGETEALGALHHEIEQVLIPFGYRPEQREFHPHLTLARSRDPRGDRELQGFAEALGALAPEPFTVREVVLFGSLLGRGGARYQVLHRAPLAAPAVG